jgi:hypothetical protein
MNSNVRYNFSSLLIFGILGSYFLSSCKTQDVLPTVSLSSNTTKQNMSGDSAIITAKLNAAVTYDVSVPLNFTGTAVPAVHYKFPVNNNTISIKAGQDSGMLTFVTLHTTDTQSRTVTIKMGDVQNARATENQSITLELINVLIDSDNDGVPDIYDECPKDSGAIDNKGCPWLGLLINEVLYDPPNDLPGDANRDGVRDPLADEFVELYNSNPPTDISGFTLSDASMVRHTFPEGTILPSNGVIIVFGGGTPTGTFGNAQVQTASGGQLNLNNAGDILTLRDKTGVKIAEFDINGLSGNPDESYSRNPDLKGNFQRHGTIPAATGALFSPGLKVDGSSL